MTALCFGVTALNWSGALQDLTGLGSVFVSHGINTLLGGRAGSSLSPQGTVTGSVMGRGGGNEAGSRRSADSKALLHWREHAGGNEDPGGMDS